MNNRDTMGDVYEYILGKMAEKGQNGQFRTPRHIIRMMVEMMKPSLEKNDAICDPAMGSAGFLVEAAHYIAENEKALMVNTEKLNYYQSKMFTGFDTDTTMLRIGAMNMLLHKIDDPNIQEQDSLSTDNPDIEQYSLILANPPFTGKLDKEVVSPTLTNLTKTNKTELLFLALFIRSLVPGGRCASIVPDGVLYGTSSAHMSIRKNLVDKQRLEAVISMPSGVFKPYSGVSTAILIFTKTGDGGTDKVWFYDMKADGFTLDDKRTPVDDNDIPDVIKRWNNLTKELNRTRKDKSFFVSVDEIRQNDYDLTFNKYKEVVREKVVYDDPKDVFARIEALEAQFAAKQQEFKEKYL
jgi:type I restriction enzyme M protein